MKHDKKSEKYKNQYKIEFAILADKMDKRDTFYQMLEDHKLKYGEIPTEYLGAWTAYLTDGRYLNKGKTWKNIPGVLHTIKKAAAKAAENKLKGEANGDTDQSIKK